MKILSFHFVFEFFKLKWKKKFHFKAKILFLAHQIEIYQRKIKNDFLKRLFTKTIFITNIFVYNI